MSVRLCGHIRDSRGSRADVFANVRLVRRAALLDSDVLPTSRAALITDATRCAPWKHGGQAWHHSAERWATMLHAVLGHSMGVNPRGSASAPLRARAWSSSSDHWAELPRHGPQSSARRCCVCPLASCVIANCSVRADAITDQPLALALPGCRVYTARSEIRRACSLHSARARATTARR